MKTLSFMSMALKPICDFIRFFKIDKRNRNIVFYSENESFYNFFSGMIDILTNHYDKTIYYVTSSPSDPILSTTNKRIIPFYIGAGSIRTIFFALYNSPLMILTMTDLNIFHIKRSPHKVNYIFVPHNILSIHMVFRKKAFNYYDTFFCAGPHHNKEIEETKKIYQLENIKTFNFGYSKIDQLLRNKNKNLNNAKTEKILIVAPSWGNNCILEKYGEALLSILVTSKWRIIIRPHPDTVRLFKNEYSKLKDKYVKSFQFEENISGMESFHKASIMISDWSGAALEFAFGLEKPVIFIDVPKKINNPDYKLYENMPIEISLRSKLGEVVPISEIASINNKIDYVFENRETYRQAIIKERVRGLYNVGNSSARGADYINKLTA